MRWVVLLGVVSSFQVEAQVRFERLTVIDDTGVPPVIFWRDARLCVPATKTAWSCHDVKQVERSEPISVARRNRAVAKLEVKMKWGGRELRIDQHEQITVGEQVTTMDAARCGLGRLHNLEQTRFVVGVEGELAVLILEEDDRQVRATRLDAQSVGGGEGHWPRQWSILFAVDSCRAD